jgi:hypothetical protein
MALTGTHTDDVREDLLALRRRIVSEIVDLNAHLPGRKPSKRQRMMRFLRGHVPHRRRSLIDRITH